MSRHIILSNRFYVYLKLSYFSLITNTVPIHRFSLFLAKKKNQQ